MLISLLLTISTAYAEPMLRVRAHLVVEPKSEVRLANAVDASEISPALQEKLKSTALTKAPAYGEKQELSSANLTALLRPLIQDEKRRTHKQIQIVIPSVVVVDTVKRGLAAEMVEAEILQAWALLCPGCKLEIEGLSLPRVQGVRDWTLHMKSELPRGSFSLPIDLVRMDGAPVSAWVSGRILTKKKVPVATRILNLGERLGAQDFKFEYRDTSYAIDGIPTAEEIVGRRAKQGLRESDILWRGMLEREKAVRAGDIVQLHTNEGVWDISVTVQAQQDAFIGDVINLKNPKTNNVIMGQITGLGEAVLR